MYSHFKRNCCPEFEIEGSYFFETQWMTLEHNLLIKATCI